MSSFQQKLALKGSETSIEHFAAVLKDVKDRGGWNTASALVRPFLLLLIIRQRNAQTQYRPHLQLLLIHLDCRFFVLSSLALILIQTILIAPEECISLYIPWYEFMMNERMAVHWLEKTSQLKAVNGHFLIINPSLGMYQEIIP